MVTYNSPGQAVEKNQDAARIARAAIEHCRAGHEMLSTRYSKEIQWRRFERSCVDLAGRTCRTTFIRFKAVMEPERELVLDALDSGGCLRS